MNTTCLQISPDLKTAHNEKDPVKSIAKSQIEAVHIKNKAVIGLNKKVWFDKDAPQNLSNKEAFIRGIIVVFLPIASGIDWVYGTSTMYALAPTLFYLAVTALTMTCPIKALISGYRNRPLKEL